MINKIFRLYILSALFSTACALAFADQPSSALDDKPSVDSTASSSAVQIPAVSSDTTAAAHTSYLYDLKKLIDKSRANIKEVNEKIKEQAVLKRNQKREERAREYYEKGVELTNEGKLDEARDYFEKAIRITDHPEMAGYIKESQRRLKKQEDALKNQERQHYNQIKNDENVRKEDVEQAYREAVDLYKLKKYHPAQDAFEHVDEIAPDYRATKSYLKIIDQDIITSDAVAAKQQAVEIEHQQKEAEAARAKEKAMWMQQIEEKEKERKGAIDQQAAQVYDEAVELYKNKKFAAAKKKFEEVSWVIPDYKQTMKYLGRIDRDAQQEQERLAREQQKTLQEQRWEEEVENKKQEALRQHELEIKEAEHKKQLEEQAQFLYKAAVSLYDKKSMDEALEKFNDIEKTSPDFKSTRVYIARIQKWQFDHGNKPVVVVPATPVVVPVAPPVVVRSPATPVVEVVLPKPVQSAMPAQVKVAVSLEDQQKQAQDIADLLERSTQLYRQIADVADDRPTKQTERKIAQVNDILNGLKQSKERLLRKMRDEQWKSQHAESQAKQNERRQEAEKAYQDGLGYLRSHEYDKAKIKFLQLENIIPDYKSTRRYLSRIDEELKNGNVEAVTTNEKNQAAQLQQLQNKENIAEQAKVQQDQEKQHNLELQQQASLKELAQKASDINDAIIGLSRTQDYQAMKEKFTELENTVTALTTLKSAMIKQKDSQEREKQLARESMQRHKEILQVAKREDQQIRAYYNVQPLKDYRPILSSQPSDLDHYKRHEILQEQNMLFSEGVDRYEHKKYTQAKLLFGELADQNDRRAEVWLKKVDRAISREVLSNQEGEERERTAFIADQVRAQHELIIIQERERQRQKKLTEELERQKRLYEDDRLLQLRKEEIMKTEERERQRQEEKRLQLEKANEKKQEAFRFHKIKIVPPPQPVVPVPVVPVPAIVVPVPAVIVSPPPAPAAPPALSAKQVQAEVDFSNKRKAYLDNKYKKEQREEARQAKIKAAADARAQYAKEKAEREKARAERLAQEKEHREEALRQQEQQREEKIKQDKIIREESQRREELEREEHERQAKLEIQREAVRKQLEDGVELMYQEALSLYKQGDYSSAADKFKDVQDIIPSYKRSGQYMYEARMKSMNAQPSDSSATSTTASTPVTTGAPQVSHQDDVTKALDLFDPNAK